MKLWTGVLDLLFPPKCPFCQKILEDPARLLCPSCQSSLPWLSGGAAERKVDFSDGCFSPLAYRDVVPEAIHRYKFSRIQAYGVPFGALLAQCVRENLDELPDGLTWAPLSRSRLRERGFDQAELLARAAGKALSVPVFPTLCKAKHTKPQSELGEAGERRANALGAYTLLPGTDVQGKRLVLVDDVVTSGATLSECARVLRQSGAARVWCAALAQARTN
ncbi:MAG: ComF family protein [Bacillota bacterium]